MTPLSETSFTGVGGQIEFGKNGNADRLARQSNFKYRHFEIKTCLVYVPDDQAYDCISEDAMKNLIASTQTNACDLLHLSEE